MSLWSKLGWQHFWLKHLNHLKTHSVLRNWCWTTRSFKNDQALIQFWINCWLQSRLTLKHGWRLRVDVELLFPQRTGVLKRTVLCDTWGSELSIIALQEAESGLKQWALYHYITSLGDGTADTDGWLKMTVQWWWFQTHCSESRAHIKRVSPCPLLWWLVAQTAVTIWFSSPVSLSSELTCQCSVQSPTSPGEKREAL